MKDFYICRAPLHFRKVLQPELCNRYSVDSTVIIFKSIFIPRDREIQGIPSSWDGKLWLGHFRGGCHQPLGIILGFCNQLFQKPQEKGR